MPASRRPVVVVGSINIDLVATTSRIPVRGETVLGGDFQTHHGGKGANQAVAVARLGYPVTMIGRLGDDAFGGQLRAGLESAGVDPAGIKTTSGSSGVAVIIVAQDGQNSIVVVPGANALLTPEDLEENIEIIRSAGIVLTQLETPLETVLHLASLCARESVPLILDPAPARDLPQELFGKVAWFTPNETEAAFFLAQDVTAEDTAQTAKKLLAMRLRGVVLKLGSRGAYLAEAGSAGQSISSFPVKAVDTTAAGDCFNGAFATGLLLGNDVFESARFAAAAAAISVTRPGAQPSMPQMADVERLLASDLKR